MIYFIFIFKVCKHDQRDKEVKYKNNFLSYLIYFIFQFFTFKKGKKLN